MPNRFYKYRLLIISIFFLAHNFVNAQCSYDNALESTWAAPTTIGDSVFTNCMYGGKYISVTGIVAGEAYKISTCGNTNFDSQITIYPSGGGTYIAYDYGACGSGQSQILFTPPSSGDYDILIDEYYCGPANTLCMYLVVQKIPCPGVSNAAAYVSPNPVCLSDPVSFYGYGDASSFVWDFGDGSPTSNDSYSTHTYTSAGTYTVSLTLTNSCGNDTTVYETVQVATNLPVSNASAYVSPNPVCPGDPVSFDGYGDASSFVWDFGDGSPTSNDSYSTHTYTSAGTYTVSLTLTNSCGNDTTVYETVQVATNLPVSNASAYVSPNPVCPGDPVSFDGYGDASSFVWDFGDGSPTSNDSYSTHTYTSAGTYTVSLTLTNSCGNDTTIYETVQVENNVFPDPNDYFYITPDEACPGDTAVFWIIPGEDGSSYLWDFGDGNTTTISEVFIIEGYFSLNVVKHVYSNPGNYTVSFTLTNGCGNSFTTSTSVMVGNNNSVDGGFGALNIDAVVNENIDFIAWGGSSYEWDFGDGSPIVTSTSTFSPVTHTYSSVGTYTSSVTITNSCGNSETYTEIIVIGPVGIQEDSLAENDLLSIYPNPSRGSFSLETGSAIKEDLTIEIMNISAQLIYRKQYNNVAKIVCNIDLSEQPKGIYFVKVKSEKNISVKKLILQ